MAPPQGLILLHMIYREMLKNSSSKELLHQMAQYLIFSMNDPWDKEIQVCSNRIPGVTNGNALRGRSIISSSELKADVSYSDKLLFVVC